MMKNDIADALRKSIITEDWPTAARELSKALESVSFEMIDKFVPLIKGSLRPYLNILVLTGIYKDNSKGEYLTKKILHRLWNEVQEHEKWTLLISLLLLYNIDLSKNINIEQCEQIVNDICRHLGIPKAEILSLFKKQCADSKWIIQSDSSWKQ